MFVYSVMPIDHWNGWQRPSDLFRVNLDVGHEEWHDPPEWEEMWSKAQTLAREIGWEGDIRTGPYVTVLPQQPGHNWLPPVVIGWKQENNGTTFIASPYELPWVRQGCDSYVEG